MKYYYHTINHTEICFIRFKKTAPHKTAVIRLLASYLTNHYVKISEILLEKLGRTHKRSSFTDTTLLADQQRLTFLSTVQTQDPT